MCLLLSQFDACIWLHVLPPVSMPKYSKLAAGTFISAKAAIPVSILVGGGDGKLSNERTLYHMIYDEVFRTGILISADFRDHFQVRCELEK